MRTSRMQTLGATLAAATCALLAACGGHAADTGAGAHPASAGHPGPSTAATLLARSRAVVDAAPALHFTLASSGVAPKSTAIVSGRGDLRRPDQLRGTFSVQVGGFTASVAVVETGGTFYAEPPFQPHYSVTDPATYGLGDPAELLSPSVGVSRLLTEMTGVRTGAAVRVAGELLDVVSGQVHGAQVPVLPDLDRAEPVQIVAMIAPGSGQLRAVRLSGPFTAAGTTTTYTVTLTGYGEAVTITAPPT